MKALSVSPSLHVIIAVLKSRSNLLLAKQILFLSTYCKKNSPAKGVAFKFVV